MVVLTTDQGLASLSLENGTIQWYVSTRIAAPQSLLAGSTAIVVIDEGGEMAAFDQKTGLHLWTHAMGESREHSRAAISSGVVVAIDDEGRILALDERDGHILWHRMGAKNAVIVTSDGYCCLGAGPNRLAAIGISKGDELWTASINGEALNLVSSQPDIFCVLTSNGIVHAFERDTGRMRWTCDTQLGTLSVFNDCLLLPAEDHLLVFGKSDPFAPRRIQCIELSSGNMIWTGVYPDIASIPAYFCQHASYFAGNCFYVLDVADGSLRRGIPNADNFFFLGTRQGSCFIAVPGAGIFRAKLNYGELHFQSTSASAQWAATQTSVIGVARAGLLGMLVLFLLLGPAALFATQGKPQVPSTAQTLLIQYALLLAAVGLCAVTAYASYLGLWFSLNRWFSWWLVGLSLSFALPVVTVLLSICFFARGISRMRAGQDADCHGAITRESGMQAIVDGLCQEMGISHRIPLVFSGQDYVAPVVVGIFPRMTRLMLPNNFQVLVEEACGGKKRLQTALTRFVLAHELAHIKNLDTFALPLLSALQGPWILCSLLSAVLFYANSRYVHESAIVLLGGPLTGTFVLGTCFLLFATRALLTSRERLADATASLYVSPRALQRLTTIDGDGNSTGSPLAKFILSTIPVFPQSSSRASWDLRRISRHVTNRLRQLIPRFPRRFARYLDVVRERGETIASKRYVISPRFLPTFGESAFVGALAALLYLFLLVAEHYVFVTHSFSRANVFIPELGGTYFDALKELTERYAQSPEWHLLEICSVFGIGLSASSLMLLPLRDLPWRTAVSSFKALIALLVRFLLVISVFWLITSYLQDRFPLLPLLGPTKASLVICIVVGAVVLLTALEFRMDLRRSRHFLVASAVFMTCAIISAVILAVIFFTEIPVLSRLLLVLEFSIVFATLGATIPRWNPFASEVLCTGEGLVFTRVLWRWRQTSIPRHFCEAIRSQASWSSFGTGLIAVTLPALVSSALLYPALVTIDLRYVEQVPNLNRKLAEFSDHALSMSHIKRSTTMTRVAAFMLAEKVFRPDGLFPSELISVVGALFLAPVSLAVFAVSTFFRKQRQSRSLDEALKLKRIERVLGERVGSRDLFELVSRVIIPQRMRKRPYITGAQDVPLMSVTCESIELLQELDAETPIRQKLIAWVQSCEAPSGGFSPVPGMSPTILHTHAALHMLAFVGLYNNVDSKKHSRWLSDGFARLMDEANSLDPHNWLWDLWLLVGTMNTLGTLDQFGPPERARVRAAVLYEWHRSDKSILTTSYCVSILAALGGPRGHSLEQIRTYWLPTNERMLSTMAPRYGLEDIWAGLVILRGLYPKDFLERPSVDQIRDNLLREFSNLD